MDRFKSIFACIALAVALLGCSKNGDDIVVPQNLIATYFPMQQGQFVEYRVDSFLFDGFSGALDTSQFFIKERIDTLWADLTGEETAVIGRYYRAAGTTNYVLTSVYRANRNARSAERLETNVRYVKLTTPMAVGSTWNSNVFNVDPPTEAKFTEVHQPRLLSGRTWDSTVAVTIIDETVPGLYKNIFRERYAAGVGLLERYIEEIDYQQDFPGGRRVVYSAVAHGIE